jgi:ribosomal protein L35AE/L33A
VCVACFRLYVKGVMMGFKRGLRNQHEHTSLLKIDKVASKEDTSYYLGKRVCFVYKAQNEIRGTKFRSIWGRITRPHGSRLVFQPIVFRAESVFEPALKRSCSAFHLPEMGAERTRGRVGVVRRCRFCRRELCKGECRGLAGSSVKGFPSRLR